MPSRVTKYGPTSTAESVDAVPARPDHPQARAAHLPLEVPHADAGLLELADGPLIARRVIPLAAASARSASRSNGTLGSAAARATRRSGQLRPGSLAGWERLCHALCPHGCWLEQLSGGDSGPYGLRSDASQHVEPVDILARLAGQGDPDLETLMVRSGEGAGCLLAGR